MRSIVAISVLLLPALVIALFAGEKDAADQALPDASAAALASIGEMDVGSHDWPQWGGWSGRNNTPAGHGLPESWDVEQGTNVKWSATLGSESYGNPVVANGQVYAGTNNGSARLERYPADVDLGCLLCFDEESGDFLWQHSNEKLASGSAQDWPWQGICSAPCVDGERLWYVTNRCEVVCLDTRGFRDGENDGPVRNEPNENQDEADVVWTFDMIGRLNVSPHNMSNCSVTCAGDILFVGTSNGVDERDDTVPSPEAPSFLALNRNTGDVLWQDSSPGTYLLHGQWSSPACITASGQSQAIFAGGDGWIYSFDPAGDGNGKSKLLWKCDCNPKTAQWKSAGSGDRNNLIATPVVYDGKVYVATGQDPEHGTGAGSIWCIDPSKAGDVSAELAVDADGTPLPRRRLQAVDPSKGERAIPNPNSAVLWSYIQADLDADGKIAFEEAMHRACGTPVIKDDLLYIADIAGLLHCLDATNGRPYWTHDLFAGCWGSPLVVDEKVYVGTDSGDVLVFRHGRDKEILSTPVMGDSVYSTPIVANNTIFISTRSKLFAIEER